MPAIFYLLRPFVGSLLLIRITDLCPSSNPKIWYICERLAIGGNQLLGTIQVTLENKEKRLMWRERGL